MKHVQGHVYEESGESSGLKKEKQRGGKVKVCTQHAKHKPSKLFLVMQLRVQCQVCHSCNGSLFKNASNAEKIRQHVQMLPHPTSINCEIPDMQHWHTEFFCIHRMHVLHSTCHSLQSVLACTLNFVIIYNIRVKTESRSSSHMCKTFSHCSIKETCF